MEGIVNILNSYLGRGGTNEAHNTVARYMLAHYDELADMRLQDVASSCYTSSASIIRLVRSFGFADYRAFRDALYNERESMTVRPFGNDRTPLLTQDGLNRDAARTWADSVADGLRMSFEKIDMSQAQKLADDIVAYERVFIVAHGAAKFFGDYLRVTTPYQGKAIVSVSGTDDTTFPLSERERTLVVVVSQRGNLLHSDPKLFARLDERAAKVWLITQLPRGLFNEDVVDEVLYIAGSGNYQTDVHALLGIAELVRQLCWRRGKDLASS